MKAMSSIVSRLSALAMVALLVAACSGGNSGSRSNPEEEVDPNLILIAAGENFETELKEALISAIPGHIIKLPAGEFSLESALNIDVDGVTLRGEGKDETMLNFAGQLTGGDSVQVTSNNVVIEDLAVIDFTDTLTLKLSTELGDSAQTYRASSFTQLPSIYYQV